MNSGDMLVVNFAVFGFGQQFGDVGGDPPVGRGLRQPGLCESIFNNFVGDGETARHQQGGTHYVSQFADVSGPRLFLEEGHGVSRRHARHGRAEFGRVALNKMFDPFRDVFAPLAQRW